MVIRQAYQRIPHARDVTAVTLLLALTLLRLWPTLSTTPFHRDEARWLHNATLLRAWRHPLSEAWQDEGYPNHYGSIDETNRRRSQPPLAMYLLGAGVALQLGRLPANGYWIMTQNTRWNTAHGNQPSAAELTAGRRTNLIVAVLTVLALFGIGRQFGNRVGATAGAALYALHPLVRATSLRAWADPLLALLVVLAALAAAAFVRRPTIWRALLFGALLGLGGAAKLSPLATAALVGVAGVILLAVALKRGGRSWPVLRLGIGLTIVPAVAFVVFVASYPYLWPDPLAHTRRMLEFRTESFQLQGQSFPAAKVEDRADAMRRLGSHLGEQASTSGLIGNWLARQIGGEMNWTRGLDLGVAIAGWLLIAVAAGRRGIGWPALAGAGVLLAQSALIVMTIGVDFERYFLPVVLTVALGAGFALGTLWDSVPGALHSFVRRLRAPKAASAAK